MTTSNGGLLGQKVAAQRSLLLLRKISRFSVGMNFALLLMLALMFSSNSLFGPRASETELQWDAERGTLVAELGKGRGGKRENHTGVRHMSLRERKCLHKTIT